MRSLRGLLVFVLSAIFVAGGAIGTLLWASLPRLDGEQPVAGLHATVNVARDALGTPTIRAADRLDLARATGFLHAQDRFFQMDLLRRSAAGEMAALLGAKLVDFDRARRRHAMRAVARQAVSAAAPEDQALLVAYAAGVNAGINALRAKPFEYLMLRATPAPWLPEDVALVVQAMWFDLTDEDALHDRRVAAMRAVLPAALVDFLVPSGTSWDAPLQGPVHPQPPIPPASVYDLRRLGGVNFDAPGSTPVVPPPAGSNSFAVDGLHAKGGGALVANDPHLALNVPALWYRARFVLEGAQPLDATGVTLPGTPLLILGANGHVAWSFTNSCGDWSDAIPVERVPGDPRRYVGPDGPAEFEHVVETIEVKGGAPVQLAIERTRWGPVFPGPGGAFAVRWLGDLPGATNVGLAWLEQAHTVEEALAVANSSGIPPQNFVAGDSKGRIGWTIAGRMPRRVTRKGAAEWDGWLEPAAYPRIVDPDGGRLWTANARVVDGAALAQIGDGAFALGARATQIRDRLLALPHAATEDDMLAIQLDDEALLLSRWRDLLLTLLTPQAVAGHSLRATARDEVERWGGHAAIESVGYRIVREWRLAVFARTIAAVTAQVRQRDPDFAFDAFLQWEGPVWRLVSERPPHLLHPAFAGWEPFLLAVLDELLAGYARQPGGIAARTWGEGNTSRIQHPLGRALPWLAPLLDMPRVPLPGDATVPRVQGPAIGASMRMAVAPGHEARGYLHVAGGQSGHPLSRFYRSGFDDWAAGKPTPFLPGQARHRLQLVPGQSPSQP